MDNKQKALVCKICGKRFKGGKAMGGHMRSHLAKLPLPPKQPPQAAAPATPSPPQKLTHYMNNTKSKILQIRNLNSTVMQTMTMPSPPPAPAPVTYMNQYREVADVTIAAVTMDESDDSTKKQKRRRSKRHRKMVAEVVSPPPQEVSSSVITNNVFSSEDCARSLMMLARDTWKVKNNELGHVELLKRSDHEEETNDNDDDDDDDEEDEKVVLVARYTLKSESLSKYEGEGKYRCETCKKAFRSYQALGGHRASHKRLCIRDLDEEDDDDVEIGDDDVSDEMEEEEEIVEVAIVRENDIGGASDVQWYKGHCGIVEHPPPRVFECPFCFKQFDSGQALGGHKKVHYYNNTTNTSYYNANNNNVASTSNTNTTNNAARTSSSSANYGDTNLVIDLNLPAPELEFSTISD